MRIAVLGVILGGMSILAAPLTAWALEIGAGPIPEEVANSVGLHRSWIAQVQLDRGRGRIEGIVLDGNTLFVTTDQGTVQAIDAETGRTLWATRVGKPLHGAVPAGANSRFVAVASGSTLALLDREKGNVVWESQTKGGPCAGITLSEDHVFVPIFEGGLEAYKIQRENRLDAEPRVQAASGFAQSAPVVQGTQILWGTDTGCIYVANTDGAGSRSFVVTGGPVIEPISIAGPLAIGGSKDGNVYAIERATGALVWQFPAGTAVKHQPVVIENEVFVIPESGGMSCLDASTGQQKWWARDVGRFLSASKDRVYATDMGRRLVALDRATGQRLATLPTEWLPIQFTNNKTDRIYLASQSGLLQCLREPELTSPLAYNAAPPAEGAAQPGAAPAQPGAAPATPDAAAPATPATPPAAANPFGS